MYEHKWIRENMNLYHTEKNSQNIIAVSNSGDLDKDFYKYANDFFDAAECVMHYLGEDAAEKQDIAKLDLWYFAMIYLYRQSLELLLKANIFQVVLNENDRKNIIGHIRHDLKQALEKIIELRHLDLDDNENAEWLITYLTDISRVDRESDMFRYPFGNNLKVLFEKQTHISLVATHDNMNKAYEILKGLYNRGTFSDDIYEADLPQLIIEGGYYYQQSVVGYKYSKYSFYPYYSSYEEVAKFLRDVIITQNKITFFMPMCYLYRNAIELGLKRLIIEDSHIENSKALNIIRKKKHSILGLWNSISEEIREYANAPNEDTTLDDALLYIQTFHNFDKSSDLFRYPCNKNMEPYFLEEKKLDIDNVSSCFEELCNFLDGVDGMLSEIKDYEAEMTAYYSDY